MDDAFNPAGNKPAIDPIIGEDAAPPPPPDVPGGCEGTKQDWLTPPWVLNAVVGALRITSFDLDPCSPGPGRSNVPALRHVVEDPLDPEGGGLRADWKGEAVWLNPPYRNPLPWSLKALDAVATKQVGLVVGLLPVRTDARWFKYGVADHAALMFLPNRLRFEHAPGVPGGSANFSCMLVLWGGTEEQHDALRHAFPGANYRPVAPPLPPLPPRARPACLRARGLRGGGSRQRIEEGR